MATEFQSIATPDPARSPEARPSEAFLLRARQILLKKFSHAGLSPQQSEDLVQECLVALIVRADRFDESRGSIDAWVSGFARNAVREWYRREASRRRSETPISEISDEGFAVESVIEQHAMRISVTELPLIEQELLYMRFSLAMSFAEIAASAGLTPVNARKRVSRSVDVLRRSVFVRDALGF